MKKMIRILTVALLCLMIALPASAAAPVLYRDGLPYTRFISGTNLLRVDGNEGEALSDIDGNLLTGNIYDNLYLDNGYITGAKTTVGGVNCYGALDLQGSVVIPFEYNIIKINGNFGVGIALTDATSASYDYSNYDGDAFWNISKVGIFNLSEAKQIAELTRDQYLDHDVVNDCINIQERLNSTITTYDEHFNALGTVKDTYSDDFAPQKYETFRENGQYGIKDREGNVIMKPSFQYVESLRYGHFIVSTGTHEGLVNEAGELVIPAEYDDIKYMYNQPYDATGRNYSYKTLGTYYCVVKDGKVGYITDNNVVTYAPRYSKDIVDVNGASMTLTDLEGNMIMCAADGVETVISGYDRVYALDSGSGYYYRVTDSEGNYGVIDWHGEVVLPCEYDNVNMSGDGKYLLVSKDYKNYQILALTYPTAAAAEAPAAEAEEAAADAPAKGGLAKLGKKNKGESAAETTDAVVETPVEAETPAAEENNNAAVGLLNSAITLLNTDAAANGASAVSLLNSAAALVGNADAANLLSSAATLLSTDAAGNASSAITLIQSALSLVK